MVKMRVGKQYVVYLRHFFQRQISNTRACIDKYVVIN